MAAPRKKTTPARPSRARSAVAEAKPKVGTVEDGPAIRDELLAKIEEEVGPFERKMNRKKQYERILIPPGTSIGYVFLARPSGVQIRIPERFDHLKSKMPSLEFAITEYGFWFTLKTKKDVAKAAKAFKVAADEVRAKVEEA